MSKQYRPYEPDQRLLLPPNLDEWLPEDHMARFVRDVVGELDLGEITRYYEREDRGFPPYHPRMMTQILFYAYVVGVPSSRKIERRLQDDVAEDRQYGKDKRGDELTEELQRRVSRLGKIREAKAALEAKAKAEADQKREARHQLEEAAREEGKKVSGTPPKIGDSPAPKA